MNRPTDDSDLKLDLQEIIDRLPPNQRRAVLLYGWGYSQKEISEITGVSEAAISQLFKRIVKKMTATFTLS